MGSRSLSNIPSRVGIRLCRRNGSQRRPLSQRVAAAATLFPPARPVCGGDLRFRKNHLVLKQIPAWWPTNGNETNRESGTTLRCSVSG